MSNLDCEKLVGSRRRAICRGYNDDGTPVVISNKKRLAYIQRWRHQQNNSIPKENGSSRRLGDYVAYALSTIGVTPHRVTRWLKKDCGCKKRQKKLNDIHQWAIDALSGVYSDAKSKLNNILK